MEIVFFLTLRVVLNWKSYLDYIAFPSLCRNGTFPHSSKKFNMQVYEERGDYNNKKCTTIFIINNIEQTSYKISLFEKY